VRKREKEKCKIGMMSQSIQREAGSSANVKEDKSIGSFGG
jgi:hypothetical protein